MKNMSRKKLSIEWSLNYPINMFNQIADSFVLPSRIDATSMKGLQFKEKTIEGRTSNSKSGELRKVFGKAKEPSLS